MQQPHINTNDQATAADLATEVERERSKKADELESNLRHFHGSETVYHNGLFKKYCYTEGMRYLANEASAHWLLDAVASHHLAINRRFPDFILWRLERHEETTDKAGKVIPEHWMLSAREDTHQPPFVAQKIPYSDFPLDSFEFYQCRNHFHGWLSMLKSEY